MTELNSISPKKQKFVKPFKQRSDRNFDTIVIGSGMGGMACAAALAKMGHKVLIIEQHYVAGGFTHAFSRKGFTWDVGVHCIGEMGQRDMPGRLLRYLSDDRIEMASMGKVYETFFYPDGSHIEFPDNRREFRQVLLNHFPNEQKAIDRYFELIREVVSDARFMFLRKVLPENLEKLVHPFMAKKDAWWSKTTKEVLDGITSDQKLIAVLTSQWGYYGSIPSQSSFGIHALVARHYWNGGYYPKHGAGSIADGLLQTVSDAGGEILVRAPVKEIIIENDRAVGVRMESGEEIRANSIISAAGVHPTVSKLIPSDYINSNRHVKAWVDEVRSIGMSPPHVCLHLGFEGDIEKSGATKSNQWFFETLNLDWAYWDVEDQNSVAPALYMSFPSLKDPAHVPGNPARHTGEVVTFVPYGAFEKWKDTRRGLRTKEYADFKKSIEDRMIAQVRKHVPKLMEHVVYHELSTPLSTTFFTRANEGAIYGCEATPKRFLSRALRTRSPIKGLVLGGSDIGTLGVTGALIGGFLAAATIHPTLMKKLM